MPILRLPPCAMLALLTVLAAPAGAETAFPATLRGHAVLPAATFLAPPADAPRDARVSGKFTGAARNPVPLSVPGDTGALHGHRPTGIALPFHGQPLQGLSGLAMERAADGSIWALTDNGFGSKANSPDALLFFHRIAPDFAAGAVRVHETVFLRDPDFRVPFRIAYEGTEARYLTGADFDPESLQVLGDTVWIGDEFGPYLIEAGLDGVVRGIHPARAGDRLLRSVDHPAISGRSVAGRDWAVPGSGGFEGLALQPGTGRLWAMLEKPLLADDGQPEGGFLRVLEFDPARRDWTGREVRFRLAEGATAIGDFNFIDETRALVIERDNGEGDPSLACTAAPAPDCFPLPARLKRVVLIDMAQVDAEGFVRRIGHVDLMDIADPEGVARQETDAARDLAGRFTFPFFTVENVMALDARHILVANDNNLPFSSGRRLDEAAATEFILLEVAAFLAAR